MTEVMDFLRTTGPFTATGLLGLVIFLVIRGQLVPKSQVDALLTVMTQQITAKTEECNTWREAHAKSEEVRETVAGTLREFAEGQRTILAFVQSLPRQPQDEP